MHLHVNPKDMVSHKSWCSNLRPKTRPKRCASYNCVQMLPQSLWKNGHWNNHSVPLSPSEGPVGHLLLHQDWFHHEAMWKKQLHCISQKIFLTGVDSDIKGLLDYITHYIIKYMFLKTPPSNQMYYLPNHTFSTFNTIPSASNKVMLHSHYCLVCISNLSALCRHICLIKLTPPLLLVVLQYLTLQCHMRQW